LYHILVLLVLFGREQRDGLGHHIHGSVGIFGHDTLAGHPEQPVCVRHCPRMLSYTAKASLRFIEWSRPEYPAASVDAVSSAKYCSTFQVQIEKWTGTTVASLSRKLGLIMGVSGLAFALVSCSFIVWYEAQSSKQEILEKVSEIAATASNPAADAIFYMNDRSGEIILTGLLSHDFIIEAKLYDDRGELFVDAASQYRPKKQQRALYRWTMRQLAFPQHYSITLNKPSAKERISFGRLELTLDSSSYYNNLITTTTQLLFFYFLFSLTFSIIIYVSVHRMITRPLARFSNQIEQSLTVEEDLGQPVTGFDRRNDEIGELAQVYNRLIVGMAERKQLEEQLRQAQKMDAVGQLTGGVAHDFNNVLAVILGNLGLAQSKLEAGSDLAKFLTPAVAATERGATLTHRLLAFARKQTLEVQDIDVGVLLDGMDDMLRRSLGEDIEIEVDKAAALWPCEVDPGQLEQALLNLAINARDAMPEGGRLILETSNTQLDESYAAEHVEVVPGDYVLLAVSDSGSGMTPEIQEQIFDPFFTTKEVGKGTGLGLSMVFGFVKQSGGHIAVYSEPGEGTTFKLYLPRSGAEAAAPLAAVTAAAPLGKPGETVLVVEDDADLRNLVEVMLEDLGYAAFMAGSGAEALEILSTAPRVDLLLTDVMLPGGMSGPALVKAALRDRAALKVLYMSGYTQNAIANKGRLDPGVELLPKPFTVEDLGRKVRAVLDG
jgi:signal transduction histidine kinase